MNVTIEGITNAYVGNYTLEIILGDPFNLAPTNNTYVNITVNHNYPPNNVSFINEYMSTTIPWPFNYTLNTSVFVDKEGDQTLIYCPTITTTATANDVSFINFAYT